jgi:opacity protein-like surface antigen
MMRRYSLAFVLLVLSFQHFLTAQTYPGSTTYPTIKQDKWEFSAMGGWASVSSPSSFVTSVDDGSSYLVGLHQDGGYAFGLNITENNREYLGFEFGYTFADQTSTFDNLSPSLQTFVIKQKIHNFNYLGLIYLTKRESRLRPYGTVGAGVSLFVPDSSAQRVGVENGLDLARRWKMSFNWGGGMKWALGKKWGLRFDFRDTVTGIPDYGIPRSATVPAGAQVTPAFRPDGQYHHLQFTVGIYMRFTP